MLVTFGDNPIATAWNVVATVFFVGVAVALFHPRSKDLRHGAASKFVWLLALGFTFTLGGLYIPIGPTFVLIQLRRGWSELEAVPATEAAT